MKQVYLLLLISLSSIACQITYTDRTKTEFPDYSVGNKGNLLLKGIRMKVDSIRSFEPKEKVILGIKSEFKKFKITSPLMEFVSANKFVKRTASFEIEATMDTNKLFFNKMLTEANNSWDEAKEIWVGFEEIGEDYGDLNDLDNLQNQGGSSWVVYGDKPNVIITDRGSYSTFGSHTIFIWANDKFYQVCYKDEEWPVFSHKNFLKNFFQIESQDEFLSAPYKVYLPIDYIYDSFSLKEFTKRFKSGYYK